jgi:integrase/recombinase XerD
LSTTEIYTHVAIGKLKDVHTLTHPARLPADVQARLVLARQEHEAHRLSAPSAQDVLSALAAEADEDEREGDD